MFYRYIRGGGRIPMDFDNLFKGQSCFLAGGSPVLQKELLVLLNQPGITVFAMNNTASVVPATLWVGGDKPMCYSPRILLDPKIMKFGVISRRDIPVNGIPWKHCPNTYFFGTDDKFTLGDFLKPHRDFVWWKNTFYMALQMAYRFGFKKVYLIGCQFKIEKNHQYSYPMHLEDDQVLWNQRTYHNCVANLKHLKPHFDAVGFEVISCTPNSLINDVYPVMSFNDAIVDAIKDFPKEYDVYKCPHSSVFGKDAEKKEQIK